MSMNIENYLHQIDSAFKDKSQNEVYGYYAGIFILIFLIAYLGFYESSFQEFENKQTQISSLESKIKADNGYLQMNPEAKIARLNQEIEKINADIIVKKDTNAYIKSKIDAISFLIYDEKVWGEYLHSISKNAKKYSVKILDYTNKFSTDTNSFGHILDIFIKSSGNYKNTISFINSLEKSDLVVDIHQLDLNATSKLNTDLNISVWGITY
jgi:hypothetical protein